MVLAAAGNVPTEETVAAARLLRQELPELRVWVVNVLDLFAMVSHRDHPHELDDAAFVGLFTEQKPATSAFHSYPWLAAHQAYIREHDQDLPEVLNWSWSAV